MHPSPFALDTIAQRQTRGNTFSVAVTTSTTQLAGANPKRIAITFGVSGANAAYVSTDRNQANGTGFPLNQSSGLMTFTLHDHGAVIQEAWFGSVLVAGATMTIMDTEVTEENLT